MRGICYHVVPQKGGKLKYFKLVNAPNLETCAANLEAMRIKFLRMGGSQQNIYGAYQANFLFLDARGRADLDQPGRAPLYGPGADRRRPAGDARAPCRMQLERNRLWTERLGP